MAGEVDVYGAGGFAAFGDGPDDEGLAAAHVAGGENARLGGLVVGVGFDVAAFVTPYPGARKKSISFISSSVTFDSISSNVAMPSQVLRTRTSWLSASRLSKTSRDLPELAIGARLILTLRV